jgi:hypothetical protein
MDKKLFQRLHDHALRLEKILAEHPDLSLAEIIRHLRAATVPRRTVVQTVSPANGAFPMVKLQLRIVPSRTEIGTVAPPRRRTRNCVPANT